jgi:hypothetical protein
MMSVAVVPLSMTLQSGLGVKMSSPGVDVLAIFAQGPRSLHIEAAKLPNRFVVQANQPRIIRIA